MAKKKHTRRICIYYKMLGKIFEGRKQYIVNFDLLVIGAVQKTAK